MNGGSFLIGADRITDSIKLLTDMQNNNNLQSGLEPALADNCIFLADVDDTSADFNLDEFSSVVVKCFNGMVKANGKRVTADDLLVFKRQDDERYHIYVPITVSKAVSQRNLENN